MANIFLAWQNRADEGSLSGGSWLTSLPLTNLQNRQVQKVARSSNANASSTRFDIDLSAPRPVGVLALVVHNISATGKLRLLGASSTAAFENLITTFASEFDNAAWSKNNVTITANTGLTLAPDGSATADAITGNATTECWIRRDFTLAGTSTITEAAFFKAGSGSLAGITITWHTGGTTQTCAATINLSTGVVTTPTGTATAMSARAIDAGNGWWRMVVSGTGTSSGNTQVRVELTADGNSGRTIFAWGAFLTATTPPTYETGYMDVWPSGVIPQDLLEWEDDNFWLGTISQQARAGFQSPYIHKLNSASPVTSRYWRVEILDSNNSDGYVQIGRLFMARGWTPVVNYAYGASIGYQDPTPIDTALSGAEYFDVRNKFRVLNFTLDYLTDSEAYNYALELQRLAGVSGEVLVMPDGGEDISVQPLRSFVGRLRQIGAVRHPNPTAYSVSFEVKELL